jgi:hypothetical protein
MVRGFTRRQRQTHDGSIVAALPLDLAAELLGKAFDQPATDPGIRALRINPKGQFRAQQPLLRTF